VTVRPPEARPTGNGNAAATVMTGRTRKPVVDSQSARRARLMMTVSAVLFSLFCLNVLLGKARILLGLKLPFLLPDVSEFLLLLLSALFFTLAALAREKAVGSREASNGEPS
jgi:heme A synthase